MIEKKNTSKIGK